MAGTSLSEYTSAMAAKVSTWVSYIASGGLTAAGMLDFLNDNALAFGVLLGIATFFVNWHYQRKHLRLAERQVMLERKRYVAHLDENWPDADD